VAYSSLMGLQPRFGQRQRSRSGGVCLSCDRRTSSPPASRSGREGCRSARRGSWRQQRERTRRSRRSKPSTGAGQTDPRARSMAAARGRVAPGRDRGLIRRPAGPGGGGKHRPPPRRISPNGGLRSPVAGAVIPVRNETAPRGARAGGRGLTPQAASRAPEGPEAPPFPWPLNPCPLGVAFVSRPRFQGRLGRKTRGFDSRLSHAGRGGLTRRLAGAWRLRVVPGPAGTWTFQ